MDKKRLYLFDNYKALLIFCVVFGHFITKLRPTYDIAYSLYTFVYAFHMPAFLFISGYFSKNVVKDGKFNKSKIINYFIIYAIAQIICCLFVGSEVQLFSPKLALWYLQFMIYAHLMLPFVSKLKTKWSLIIFTALGVISTLGDVTAYLSLTKFLSYFPYFLIGYYFDIDKFKKLFTKKYVLLSILILVGFFVFVYLLPKAYKSGLVNLFYGDISFDKLGFNVFIDIAIKLCQYICSIVLTFALLIIMPKEKNIFTYIGQRTLQIFILHIPLAYMFMGYNNFITKGFDFYKSVNTPIEFIILCFIPAIITLVLSLKIFSYPFDKIMSLKFDKLNKSTEC